MATKISDIKLRNSIIDIAAALGLDPIIRAGKATANCPGCNDNGNHLYLYQDTNRFYCFKCRASGDLIDLWQLVTGATPKEAIAAIKQRYGDITPSRPEPAKIHTPTANDDPLTDSELSDIYMAAMLQMPISTQALDYLHSRGIGDKLINRYSIGSIDDPNRIKTALIQEIGIKTLYKAGLIDYSKNGKPYLTFFMPAVIFPHSDIDITKLTSLSSRNLSGNTKTFKLHNQPTKPFYGQDVRRAREIYVFEGIINGLSYAELTSLDNFISLGGTPSQAAFERLRSQFPNQKLILALDPDQAGTKALAEIHNCAYLNYQKLATELGFQGLQFHPNGKEYDLNDYLITRQK